MISDLRTNCVAGIHASGVQTSAEYSVDAASAERVDNPGGGSAQPMT
jgi:hypothetical protein